MMVADLDVAADDLHALGLPVGDVAHLALAQFAEQRGVTRQEAHVAVLARNLRGGDLLAGHQLFRSPDFEKDSVYHSSAASSTAPLFRVRRRSSLACRPPVPAPPRARPQPVP